MRRAGGPEVASSSLAAPTKKLKDKFAMQNSSDLSKFWEKIHSGNFKLKKEPDNKFLIFLKECIYFSYSQYELFFKILPKFLNKDQSLLEIGSAPGRNLVLINKLFGCKVYGIENEPKGYKQNRKVFKINGLPQKNIFNGDVLNYKTLDKFDVIFSNGFIEHFENPEKILNLHTSLLKKNGLIICIIPNFLNINFTIQKIFDRKILEYHNLKIMKPNIYRKLFKDYKIQYSGYYGMFPTRIFQTNNNLLNFIIMILKPLRLITNSLAILFSLIIDTNKISFSPFLIVIGKKR